MRIQKTEMRIIDSKAGGRKVKKRLLASLILLVVLCTALVGSAQAYSYGSDGHLHQTYCDLDPNTCRICGMTTADGIDIYVEHRNMTIQHDAKEHWRTCSACGEETYRSIHYADCTAADKCQYCEASASELTTLYLFHGDTHYEHNADEHWEVCNDCGERTSSWSSSHTANDGLTACSVCGAPQSQINMGFTDSDTGYKCTLNKSGTVSIDGFGTTTASSLTIPSKIQGHSVVSLRKKYSSDVDSLDKVVIPTSITSIDPEVFKYHTVLTVTKGSYAETYAKDQGLQYAIKGQTKTLMSGATTVAGKVKEIVNNVIADDMTEYQKVIALHNYLVYNSHYDTTYTYYHADGILLLGTGVCQSYTEAYGALLDALDIDHRYEYGDNHIWNLIKIDGKWSHVDATWDDPLPDGYENHEFFAITDFALEDVPNHEREHQATNPASTAYENSYAYRNGLLDQVVDDWVKGLEEKLAQGVYTATFIRYDYGINDRMAMQMIQDRKVSVNGYKVNLTVQYAMTDSGRPQFTVTVNPIAKNPASVKVRKAGDTATTKVVPLGTGLTYQWYYKNPDKSKFSKSSVTKDTYSIKMSEENNGRQVYCEVTDQSGKTTKSSVATLSIAEPPKITTQPSSATVTAGDKVSFKVVAENANSYQWQYKDVGGSWTNSGYSSAKTATLSFPATADMNGRQYRCNVTNGDSDTVTTSSIVTLTVNGAKPAITTQPVSATVNAGDKASFTVVAVGTGLSYQWQYKVSGGSWTDSGYSSAKAATLSFPATEDMSGRQYRCKITNSAGTTTSSAATLTVKGKPVITTQPVSATVNAGEKASFKVVAENASSYQWQYKVSGGSWTDSGYSSAKAATLSFPTTEDMNGRQYRCKVTNSAGTTTSSAATLTVNGKPAITTQPVSATVTAGEKASFKVVATGTGMTYQWQYKVSGGSWTDSGYSSAKTATLSFPATEDMNGRQYRCKITNSIGTATSSAATLTVNGKPAITTQPVSATVNAGDKASFKVVATNAGSYQWQYKVSGGSWTDSGYSSAKAATLSFPVTADMNGRQYRCKVTNSAGTVTSSAVTLSVKPAITTQPSSATVTAGNKATFKVVAAGASSYQWQYKVSGGSWTDSGYSSAKTATLSFPATADMSGRQYRCKVTNSAGTATSSTATLTVTAAKPTITTQPSSATVSAGNKATFTVAATGTDLTYQWQYKNEGGSWANSGYTSAKTATLSFTATADMSGRQYRCKVTNSAGTTTSSAATLSVKPGITAQPSSATVSAGNKATFTVAATGASSYQWQYKDVGGSWTDSGYSSAKTATLSFTATAEMSGRQYRCKITNSAGTTTSSTVTLSVKPGIATQPANTTSAAGKSAFFKVVATGTGLTYQWQYKDAGGSWTNSGYSSAKTATLSFTAAADMNGRQYRCKVTNSAGTTTSSTATLTVK